MKYKNSFEDSYSVWKKSIGVFSKFGDKDFPITRTVSSTLTGTEKVFFDEIPVK